MFIVCEAYLENEKIVLRYSEPVHHSFEDSLETQQEYLEYITRWLFPTPVGDTGEVITVPLVSQDGDQKSQLPSRPKSRPAPNNKNVRFQSPEVSPSGCKSHV